MKPSQRHKKNRVPVAGGFTLTEMIVTVAVFAIMVVYVIVALQIFTMRVYTTAAAKLSASDGARKTMNSMRDKIRAAGDVEIGNWSGPPNTFTNITSGYHQGNALKVYTTTNLTSSGPYLIYYIAVGNVSKYGVTTNQLMLYNSTNDTLRTLAGSITNTVAFDAEDVWGNVLTNNVNNRVIKVTLDFFQWEYAVGNFGTNGLVNNAHNSYRLQTRATQRSLN